VLLELKTGGPRTARELAGPLGVSPVAVRQHLAALAAEGLVQSHEERRPVGRPVRVYALAPEADRRFPDGHAELTVDLLVSLRRALGPDALDRVVADRTRHQLAVYRRAVPGRDAPLRERVAALARQRTAEGYMAEWREEADGAFLLLENHCPVCAAASVCQGLCRQELELFRRVLGARVERTEHLLAGARRCAYRVGPAGRSRAR
jgi:predicted ArsR family transcriptional regulator